MNLNAIATLSPNYTLIETENEIMFLPSASVSVMESKIYCVTDVVGASIIKQLDGKISIIDIITEILNKFDTSEEVATNDVCNFILQMQEGGLIDCHE